MILWMMYRNRMRLRYLNIKDEIAYFCNDAESIFISISYLISYISSKRDEYKQTN
jgi:hypothetical protein